MERGVLLPLPHLCDHLENPDVSLSSCTCDFKGTLTFVDVPLSRLPAGSVDLLRTNYNMKPMEEKRRER